MIDRACLSIFLFLAVCNVAAEPELLGPVEGSVIYETKYRFFVSTYEPKTVFDPALVETVNDEILHTTDQLASKAFGHRAAGDVGGYLELANESFARDFTIGLQAKAQTRSEIAEDWRRELKNALVELTHHVFYGRDEMIRYSIIDRDSGNERSSGFFYFERGQSGRWMLGNLPRDSLLRRWRVEDVRELIEIDE
jgi:hypothetical protein